MFNYGSESDWINSSELKVSSSTSPTWLVDTIFTERLPKISLTLTSESHDDVIDENHDRPLLQIQNLTRLAYIHNRVLFGSCNSSRVLCLSVQKNEIVIVFLCRN